MSAEIIMEAVPRLKPDVALSLRESFQKASAACKPLPPEDPFAELPPNPFDLDIGSKDETDPGIRNLARICGECPIRLGCMLVGFEELGAKRNTHVFWAGLTPRRQKSVRNQARRAVDAKWGDRPKGSAYETAVAHTAFLHIVTIDSAKEQ